MKREATSSAVESEEALDLGTLDEVIWGSCQESAGPGGDFLSLPMEWGGGAFSQELVLGSGGSVWNQRMDFSSVQSMSIALCLYYVWLAQNTGLLVDQLWVEQIEAHLLNECF